jgi:ABC-type Fe3+ transport system substrate-binding protein
MTERRAGKYLVDLFIDGVVTPIQVYLKANILEPIRPNLLLPEVVDESRWWEGKHHYADPEGKYIFIFQGNVHGGENAYNTKLVNPKAIKSYWDFLEPKWKGKIVAYDVNRVSNVAHSLRFLYNHPDLGPEFMRRFFGEMDITYSRDDRQMIDWLAAGKFQLAFFVGEIEDAAVKGLPVKLFEPSSFKEGAFVGPSQGGVSFFKNAPHPNAAKVAINWLLSQEGQNAYQDIFAQLHDVRQSMREDIPKDIIPPSYRRVKGVKYIYSGRPEWLDMDAVTKLIKDVQKEAKK